MCGSVVERQSNRYQTRFHPWHLLHPKKNEVGNHETLRYGNLTKAAIKTAKPSFQVCLTMRLPYACFWLTYCRKGNQKTVTVREDRVGVRKRHIWLTLCPQTFSF